MSEIKKELTLIPKSEKYIQYMLEIIMKLPRTEKFSIGNEYKQSMYKMLENILMLSKVIDSEKINYINMSFTAIRAVFHAAAEWSLKKL